MIWKGCLVLMIDYKETIWWFWLVLACLLTAGVSGCETAFILPIGVSVLQLMHSLGTHDAIHADAKRQAVLSASHQAHPRLLLKELKNEY
jgi:hypothetical protein